jgi:dimethylamine--corrinoid protein Co-methyltransferase
MNRREKKQKGGIAMVLTRMGDGSFVEMTTAEIRVDVEAGIEDAVKKAKCPPLTDEDTEHLMDIICDPRKFVSVERGNELVLTYDSQPMKFARLGIPIDRVQILQIYERALMADTLEMAYVHYSAKPVKTILPEEQYAVAEALLTTTPALLYGVMPNMPTYTKPDGPCENAAELLPKGMVTEAREAQMEAASMLEHDLLLLGAAMNEAGADGLDFDTSAAGGDAEFYACLRAVEQLRAKYPRMNIEVGMSSEFVLGFHSALEYKGERLAGMYPHKQCRMLAEAGANVAGVVVNTNSSRSFPWNLARALTMCKYAAAVSTIPVHANVGMGVGGVPMQITPPIDCVSRASTAMAEIGKLDGL